MGLWPVGGPWVLVLAWGQVQGSEPLPLQGPAPTCDLCSAPPCISSCRSNSRRGALWPLNLLGTRLRVYIPSSENCSPFPLVSKAPSAPLPDFFLKHSADYTPVLPVGRRGHGLITLPRSWAAQPTSSGEHTSWGNAVHCVDVSKEPKVADGIPRGHAQPYLPRLTSHFPRGPHVLVPGRPWGRS